MRCHPDQEEDDHRQNDNDHPDGCHFTVQLRIGILPGCVHQLIQRLQAALQLGADNDFLFIVI